MRSNVDHCVYYKKVGEHFIYVVLYVDDIGLDLCATNLIFEMEIKRNHANRKL